MPRTIINHIRCHSRRAMAIAMATDAAQFVLQSGGASGPGPEDRDDLQFDQRRLVATVAGAGALSMLQMHGELFIGFFGHGHGHQRPN